ncbi:Casein kinase II regulatory subunit family protein [Tritrichomonas foetus]|uniref:Casein kinase II subunit beta n=1 Tax=Tritrichomonas foetus TaxID=1144522 RepID=A0A1J4KVV1_9EUKA|nr:Casein kinase II regulatory subunit family protein [Tritrichomonas foetus]|eukprot:OHT13645.1 Casein kinase II regulatory subunit family protein [Tritrichomonas foetus]
MAEKWIDSYLKRPNAKLLIRVDDEFLQNTFNITGIKPKMRYFNPAYELIRRNTITSARGEIDRETASEEAEILYGYIHARFLLTKPGMQQMFEKYQNNEFQQCPRVYCRATQCIPFGISEEYGEKKVKMFCPCCRDIYDVIDPDTKNLDGSSFGPSWVHMFLQKYPTIVPKDPPRVYVPKIYGFRICHSSDAESDYSEYSD